MLPNQEEEEKNNEREDEYWINKEINEINFNQYQKSQVCSPVHLY